MKENKEFEEWYEKEPVDTAMREMAKYTYESHKEWSRKAYMMQQSKIDALKRENEKLSKALFKSHDIELV